MQKVDYIFILYLGEEAAHMVVSEARRIAQWLNEPERGDLLRCADNVEALTNQLADLIKQGKVCNVC